MMKSIISRSTQFLALATMGFVALSSGAFAQEATQKAASADQNMLQKWVIAGGWTMIPLVILLFFVLILVVYNASTLKQDRFCPADLRDNLMQLMAECRVRSAIELASTSPSYLGRLAAYALPNMDATRPEDLGKDAIEDSIADFTANESRRIFKWINVLSLCGQISPMIGLFGTVQGMVMAFGVLGATGQADPAQLAGSISVALLTTFWGLIIAIISVPLFFVQKNIANAHIADCVGSVEEMVNMSINTVNAEAQIARIPEGLA